MWMDILKLYLFGAIVTSPLTILMAVGNVELDGPAPKETKIKEAVKWLAAWPITVPMTIGLSILELISLLRGK